MLENQEPQENQPELTIEQKIEQAGLTELATTKVTPLLDVLGLETTFYGNIDGVWTTGSEVPLRQELEQLHKTIKSLKSDKDTWYSKYCEEKLKATKLEDYLDENWESVDEEVRDELCSIFGIEDTVTKTVNITITGTIDVTAPRGYDWDYVENDLSIDSTVRATGDLDESGYGWSHDDTEIEVDQN